MDLKDLGLGLVLDWLPLRDVVRCGHACSRWRGVAKDPVFWRNKRLELKELKELDDCLAVVSFAPCLRELHFDVSEDEKDMNYVEPDAFYTLYYPLVEVIKKSGIKITKLKLEILEGSEHLVNSLLLAVSEYILELEIDDVRIIDDGPFMPKLRVLTINDWIDESDEFGPLPICTGSLEVLEMRTIPSWYVPLELIHHNAANIQELRLGGVSWDELGEILKLKRLRLLEVFKIIGDAPTPLPTPECQLEILKLGPLSPWQFFEPYEFVSVATNHNALPDLLSSSVSELTLHSPTTILLTHLAAMPKLRRLHLQSASDGDSAAPTCTLIRCPENSSPIAPVEYVYMDGFDTTDMAYVLKTFAATLKEASLCFQRCVRKVKLAKLPTQGRGGRIDDIRLESSALAANLPLLPLPAATLRKISFIFPTLKFFDPSVVFDIMSYIIQHISGELPQVEILYSPRMTEEARKNLRFGLQPLRQKVPNFTIRPYSKYEQRQIELSM